MQTTKALYNRIAAYVNSHGGLDGCNIEFVYYDFLFGDPAGESDNSQNECTTFAEDDHVFAELNLANENQTLISCLAKKHTVILYGAGCSTGRPRRTTPSTPRTCIRWPTSTPSGWGRRSTC